MASRPFAVLALAISGAWLYLLYQSWQMNHLPMSQMWMPPGRLTDWGLGDFGWVWAMWAVMMAAMMLPSALPMLSAYSRYCRRDAIGRDWRTLWFAGAYLAVWIAFSAVLTLMQWLFHGLAWLSPMMENRQPLLAAAILLTAGGYQFTAFKHTCLRHCRTPLSFLLRHWSPGSRGAARLGVRHGLECLGCCWAQMLVMFAVGVMNLYGMLMITLLVIAEKWSPAEAKTLSYGSGLAFVAWGLYSLPAAI
ncbi:MAG: DUF2182 domain-containing protein [Methylococcales bacterium]|nr:DUF2182 domain-containing protein [Methylococcales bacterium]